MFEPYNMDDVQHILKQISDKYTNTTIFFSFFSANYIKIAVTKSSVSTWIFAFSFVLIISVIFISTTFIMLW